MRHDTETGVRIGRRGGMLAMVGLSFVTLFLAVAFRNGMDATPYKTIDSVNGHPHAGL
jgi:hypothetical protein